MEVLDCCRCCLSTDEKMKTILSFIDLGGKLGQVKEILADWLNVRADEDDGLPEKVCLPCVATLQKIYTFKKKILRSYKYLSNPNKYNIPFTSEYPHTARYRNDVTNKPTSKIEVEASAVERAIPNLKTVLSSVDEDNKEIFEYGMQLEAEDEGENSACDADDIEDSNYNQDLEEQLPPGVQLFYCILCEEKFEKREQLYKHCCDVHKPLNKSGKACEYCNECSVYASVLALHKRKHLTPFACPLCPQGATHTQKQCKLHSGNLSNRLLYRATRSRKADEIAKKIMCQCHICGKSYKRNYIVSHMKIHKEGEYVCKYCGKIFTQPSPFAQHMNVHLRRTSVKCMLCDKTFHHRNYMTRHVKTVHMKEKNFFCDVCGRGFFAKMYLVRHLSTHTGEKTIKCHICDKSLSDAKSIRRHLKHQHNISPALKTQRIKPVVDTNN